MNRPVMAAYSSGVCGRGSAGTQFEQSKQDLVPLCGQVVDRARSHLSMNAHDQLLLELGGQLRRSQDLPPCRHRTGKLLQKVLHATLAATEMVEEHLTHDAPSEAGSPADRGVDVGDADDTLAH